jgi:surface antigen
MPVLRTAVVALAAIALAIPALARDEGVKIEVKDERGKYEYKYEDRFCKFKYEFKYDKGEEKVEEKGDCPPFHALPQFDPPVPYRAPAVPAPRRTGGFCDRALAGAIVGAVAGGTIGSRVASGDDRAVAIIVGGILGGVLGHEIGRRIDEADRRCMARALEHAEPGVEVGWENPDSGLAYGLRGFGPLEERHGVYCRHFELRVEGGRWREAEACRRGDGSWQLVSLE